MATIVVYGGGFQPFHEGHLSSYVQAKKALGDATFYVAASNDVKQRPIPFKDKQFLAQQAGVVDPFIETKNPINPQEILAQYDPEQDVYIMVRSERDPVPYTKKDGSPAYYQPYVKGQPMAPFSKHGYVFVTKKHNFTVNGEEVYSGSQVRSMYGSADDAGRMKMIQQLYPKSKQQQMIKKLLDKYLASPQEPAVMKTKTTAMSKLKNKALAEQISRIRPLIKEASPQMKLKFMRLMKTAITESKVNELSPQTLATYKKKAGADATASDKVGNFKRGDKRMSGIMKATRKEFDNDSKNVTEAFDQPYKLKWEKSGKDITATTKLDDGGHLGIMFQKGYNQDKEEAWSVEFYRNNSQEVTGEGDAQRVFSTVLSSIQSFIKKYAPNKVMFAASKEADDGQNSQSRARLYDSLVQRYAKSWGFRAFRAETGNKVFYELSRRDPVKETLDDPWGDQGNFAGDKPVNIGGDIVKRLEVGDIVLYLGQKAKILAQSKPEGKYSRIEITKGMGGVIQDVLTSDLKRTGGNVEEARTNPEQNRKSGSGKYDLINYAEDNISDKDNWAVSMTIEPKLGINPQAAVSEDTPKGIYFYPLRYFMQLADRDESLPWGDNFSYLQLFQYDRSDEMTQQTKVDPAKLKQALLQYCPEEVIQQAIDEPEYDGTPYWFIYDCLSRLGKGDETNVIRWNKVLRDLGFTSVFDPGKGWIAYNEPTQGVVLDPRIIKQHKMFDNRNPTLQNRRYDIQGLADAIGWSSYYQRETQLQRVQINHPDEKKVMLDVAKTMLRPFLGKSDKEAKAMGYDQAIKAAADKVIEILKQSTNMSESVDYLEEK